MAAAVDGGRGGSVCGLPKLIRANSGGEWKTCSPDAANTTGLRYPDYPVVRFAGDGKLYVAFWNRTTDSRTVRPGVIVWREP